MQYYSGSRARGTGAFETVGNILTQRLGTELGLK